MPGPQGCVPSAPPSTEGPARSRTRSFFLGTLLKISFGYSARRIYPSSARVGRPREPTRRSRCLPSRLYPRASVDSSPGAAGRRRRGDRAARRVGTYRSMSNPKSPGGRWPLPMTIPVASRSSPAPRTESASTPLACSAPPGTASSSTAGAPRASATRWTASTSRAPSSTLSARRASWARTCETSIPRRRPRAREGRPRQPPAASPPGQQRRRLRTEPARHERRAFQVNVLAPYLLTGMLLPVSPPRLRRRRIDTARTSNPQRRVHLAAPALTSTTSTLNKSSRPTTRTATARR